MGMIESGLSTAIPACAENNPALLRLRDVRCRMAGRHLLNGISFDVAAGESVALLGPNGAGKSTLLRVLAGELPYLGDVHFHDQSLRDWQPVCLSRLRAVMPQQVQMNFPLTVEEVVALGLPGRSRGDTLHPLVSQLIDIVNVGHLRHRRYPTLSGGEQQRTQLARVLIQIWEAPQSALLLLDECISALDPCWQHRVLARLRECRQRACGILWSVHDFNLAAQYADRIVLVKDGQLMVAGTPDEVLTPQHLEAVFGIRVDVIRLRGIPHVIQLGFVSDT